MTRKMESVGACSGDKLVIAYEVKEDMDADSLENPQQIADYLCEELGMDVKYLQRWKLRSCNGSTEIR